jgi:hypothetical protein
MALSLHMAQVPGGGDVLPVQLEVAHSVLHAPASPQMHPSWTM